MSVKENTFACPSDPSCIALNAIFVFTFPHFQIPLEKAFIYVLSHVRKKRMSLKNFDFVSLLGKSYKIVPVIPLTRIRSASVQYILAAKFTNEDIGDT